MSSDDRLESLKPEIESPERKEPTASDTKYRYVPYKEREDSSEIVRPFKDVSNRALKPVSEIDFEELVDLDSFADLINDTSHALNLAMLLTTPQGQPLTPIAGGSDMCSAVRSIPTFQERCEASDASFMDDNGLVPAKSFTCGGLSNLRDGSAAIYLQDREGGTDRLMALWLTGQVRTEVELERGMPQEDLALAESEGMDQVWLKKQWDSITFMPLDEFNKKVDFISVIASQLSEAAYATYESSFLASELQEKNERLTQAKAGLEGEVVAHTRHLAEANEVLAESLNHRRLFLSRCSHDMRTPLLGINGTAILMQEEEESVQAGGLPMDASEMASNLSIMQTSCELLLSYIDQLLDFSRLEALEESSEPIPLEETPLSLPEFLHSATRLFDPNAVQKSIHLSVDNQPWTSSVERPGLVHLCDPLRLTQLLSNLTGNAMKFTPHGGFVTVAVELLGLGPPSWVDPEGSVAIIDTKETLTTEHEVPAMFSWAEIPAHYPAVSEGADLVAFSVSDTGPGIEEDRIYSIFSAFSQEDVSTPRVYGGSGLGLSMCRSVCVDMYGGLLVVGNQPTGGALFVAILPLCRSDKRPSSFAETVSTTIAFQRHGIDFDLARSSLGGVEQQMTHEADGLDETAVSVLVVDDVDVNRIVIGRLLRLSLSHRNRQCRVHFAADGGEAIEKIQLRRYDLILMDLFMPKGIGGHDAIKAIRALESDGMARHTVIAVTASASPEVEERCQNDGFDGILHKPFKMECLEIILDVVLAEKSGDD
ncbi:Histidine kinase-, DNA gyrase B-, and HSP90-like ATPase [Carpediemonas membranifera]|uniref:histidine kinase n=1 Tax=Carpediemonas membranifera TaxID=201153 RepID=A0A8J6E030_9EUKA|nr:Histidine kinase-, DNA gyrase B-, and HSP90-like ATPase [Carpediemonas membranifera]|eukprot:KAG9391241.1 Histidine kinase-, DNA gyrase B-, and HSP90-like ATPase [Carpediemonas membranifera]